MCLCLRFSVFMRTLVLALAFLSVCMDFCACACVSHCFYGLQCLCLCFSVFIWTLVLVLAFLSVCMNSRACISQCFYGLLCLRLHFSVFAWTLVFAMRFLEFVWTLVLLVVLVFISVCMNSCTRRQ